MLYFYGIYCIIIICLRSNIARLKTFLKKGCDFLLCLLK